MKILNKLSDDHFIIVEDSPTLYDGYNGIVFYDDAIRKYTEVFGITDANKECKIITYSTKALESYPLHTKKDYIKIKELRLSEVKKLIGEPDVEEKAYKHIRKVQSNAGYVDYITGYNQCLKDNEEKKYTEEDMRKAFEAGNKRGWSGYPNTDNWTQPTFEKFIQSFQPKTQWKVKFDENNKLKLV